MDCSDVRAALSARLDGEPSGVDDDVVDTHLAACDDCRAWFDRAVALNRSLLMGPAPGERPELHDVPGHPDLDALSERILSTVEPERRRRERSWTLMSVGGRVILVILGVLYLAWGVVLLAGAGAHPDPAQAGDVRSWTDAARLAADAAALRFAFAVGLFWGAWRPRAAMGMAPVYGAAATFSAGFAAVSLVLGQIDAAGVAALVLQFAAAAVLAAVWLGGYTPQALAQAWRAAAGRSIRGLPDSALR